MQGDSPLWNSAQENTNSDSLRCFAPPKKSRLGPGWSQQERRNVNARRVQAHKELPSSSNENSQISNLKEGNINKKDGHRVKLIRARVA